MITLRRKTRETLRHERAVVLQQKGCDAADQLTPAQIAANKRRAAELKAWADRKAVRR